jgi:tripartite-type tricarboxylate transporter receptor subunit TctC
LLWCFRQRVALPSPEIIMIGHKIGFHARLSRRTALTLFGSVLVSAAAKAEAWPNRPVRVICPFAPGGTADVFARILADRFSAAFGQPFYVDTKAGAGGQIGSVVAATAKPDGYTLIVTGNASDIIAPAFADAPQYDGVKDFRHIAYLGGPPIGLLVHPSLPVDSYADFIAFAKASSEPVEYTSSGVGTHGFLFGEELARKEGLKLVHIPYQGGGPAMIDLLAGRVKVATITFSSGAEQVRSGKLKALAISSEKRLSKYPDTPTFVELGRPDLVSLTWFVLSGPKDLPTDIVDRLNHETEVVLDLADIKERLERDAIEVKAMSPDEVAAFVQQETNLWAPLARDLRGALAKAENSAKAP